MSFIESEIIEYRKAHYHPVPARPDGMRAPRADLAKLFELMYNTTDMAHGEGLVSIVAKKADGHMVTVSTLPVTRLCEFSTNSLYVLSDRDYYVTKATFKTVDDRSDRKVFGFDFLAVEVDGHKSRLPANELITRAGAIVDILRNGPVADGILPDPNLAIISGRGVHLVWLIDRVYQKNAELIKEKTNKYADVISKELKYYPFFDDFEVDRIYCNNPHGLVRLPGTINLANGAEVTYELYHQDRMTLRVEDNLPKVCEEQILPQPNASSVSRTGLARMRALEALVDLRGSLCMGMRDQITLLYFCSALMAGYPIATCETLALKLNSFFVTPRPEAEVIRSLSSARKKKYKYSDKTIIRLLDLSADDLKMIGWHAITGGHEKRDMQRAAKKEERISEVLQMYADGKTISEISRVTRHSRTSIRKWINAAREKNSVISESSESTNPVDNGAACQSDSAVIRAADLSDQNVKSVHDEGGQYWSLNNIYAYYRYRHGGRDPP